MKYVTNADYVQNKEGFNDCDSNIKSSTEGKDLHVLNLANSLVFNCLWECCNSTHVFKSSVVKVRCLRGMN